ncbi:Protein of unknown function, partial [Gryllus bimaculatus]
MSIITEGNARSSSSVHRVLRAQGMSEASHLSAAAGRQLRQALHGLDQAAHDLRLRAQQPRVARSPSAAPAPAAVCGDILDSIHRRVSNIKYQVLDLTEMLEKFGLPPAQALTQEIDQAAAAANQIVQADAVPAATSTHEPSTTLQPSTSPPTSTTHTTSPTHPSSQQSAQSFRRMEEDDAEVEQQVILGSSPSKSDTNTFVSNVIKGITSIPDKVVAAVDKVAGEIKGHIASAQSHISEKPVKTPAAFRAAEESTTTPSAIEDIDEEYSTPATTSERNIAVTSTTDLYQLLQHVEQVFKDSFEFRNSTTALLDQDTIDNLTRIDMSIVSSFVTQNPNLRTSSEDQVTEGTKLSSLLKVPELTVWQVPAPTFVPYPMGPGGFGLQTLKTQQQLFFSPAASMPQLWTVPVCFPAAPAPPSAPAPSAP